MSLLIKKLNRRMLRYNITEVPCSTKEEAVTILEQKLTEADLPGKMKQQIETLLGMIENFDG